MKPEEARPEMKLRKTLKRKNGAPSKPIAFSADSTKTAIRSSKVRVGMMRVSLHFFGD